MPEELRVEPFTGQNPAAPKGLNGMLGLFELFRKFYAMEEYSLVAKTFRRVYTHKYGGRN